MYNFPATEHAGIVLTRFSHNMLLCVSVPHLPFFFLSVFVVFLHQADTMKVIDECNGHWRSLVDGKTEAGKMWTK